MKKAVILEIVLTKNQILPCQFEGDIWTTVRRIDMLTPEESCHRKRNCLLFSQQPRLGNCDDQM